MERQPSISLDAEARKRAEATLVSVDSVSSASIRGFDSQTGVERGSSAAPLYTSGVSSSSSRGGLGGGSSLPPPNSASAAATPVTREGVDAWGGESVASGGPGGVGAAAAAAAAAAAPPSRGSSSRGVEAVVTPLQAPQSTGGQSLSYGAQDNMGGGSPSRVQARFFASPTASQARRLGQEEPAAAVATTNGGLGSGTTTNPLANPAAAAAHQRQESMAKAQFDQWAATLQPRGRGDRELMRNLESFLDDTHTSMSQVAAWLNDRSPRMPGGAAANYDVHDELKRCLHDMIHDSHGTRGFNDWMANGEMPRSPFDSDVSDGDLRAEAEDAFDPDAPRHMSTRHMSTRGAGLAGTGAAVAGLAGGAAVAAHAVRAGSYKAKPGSDVFFTLTSPQPAPPMRRALSKQPSAYVSAHLQRARSAMQEAIPVTDAAAEEVAAWGSTEDEDFVTPWYTYVMRCLMLPLGALIFYFIYWRCANYPRADRWWENVLAWIFIISEAVCFLFGMTHWVWMWNLKFRKRITQAQVGLSDDELPTIDIMIPCYSEPTEIVEMTLKACYDMDYPAHKITCWVCDDGKSDDMREMVELTAKGYKGKMRTRYVARTKIPGVPHHAKAGNLNNCILKEGSSGQLIIVLDCDMLPEPCMARTVAPFFFTKPKRDFNVEGGIRKAEFDNTVGLLQTPQAFYNLDSKDLLGQSYAFFYECQMSGWDGSGCTPCCGTGVTFNRFALEKVGGFSTGSITEDFKTSLNLCANGFQCKYFLQRMTRGVSPKELNAFMIQRLRWAVGAIQILLAGNPLLTKGLHLRARWLYFWSTVGIVYILFVIAMGLVMYGTILAGVAVQFGPTSFTEYLIFGGSAVALMMVMQYLAGWRLCWRDYLRALQDNFTVFATLVRAILIGFCGMEMGFAVTAKDVTFDLKANLYHAAPHLFVYLLSGAAMVRAVLDILDANDVISLPGNPTEQNTNLLYFSMMWTAFLWVMVSGPPRMVLYGWRRARREAASAIKCTNNNVPALQELPATPMNTFPPLSPELWAKQEGDFSDEDVEGHRRMEEGGGATERAAGAAPMSGSGRAWGGDMGGATAGGDTNSSSYDSSGSADSRRQGVVA